MRRNLIVPAAVFCVVWFSAAASVSAQANEQVRRYTVLLAGRNVGSHVSIEKPDGWREFDFRYTDRRREPRILARVKIDANALPVSLETKGQNTNNVPIAESFSLVNGQARWSSDAENGEKAVSGRAFYLSLNSAPEELALLANAVLKSPRKRLPLLPSGEASIERAGELTLKKGAETRRVTGYGISGLGFSPDLVWLDEDGRYFGSLSGWTTVIREGWEASAPDLLKVESEFETKRFAEIARKLTRKPAKPVVFTNANLFDAESGKIIQNSTVVIEGNRITAVGKNGAVEIPKNSQRIDARGKTLMPGLWDMHAHVNVGSRDHGLLHVAAGVTSVRDLANDPQNLLEYRRLFDRNEEIGPRIIAMAGIIDGRGPLTGPTKFLVDTEEEALAAVNEYARLGFTGIKIYSSIKPELVPKIVELARAKGMRVQGHVPVAMTADEFIRDGAEEIQHIVETFANEFLIDNYKALMATGTLSRRELYGKVDFDSPAVRRFVQLLREKNVTVDPTVIIYEGSFTARPGIISPTVSAIADRLPPNVRRVYLRGGLLVPEGKDAAYRASFKAMLRMIKALYDAGVPLVAGTDALPGFALHRELELYVEAGIPAPEVLRIATINAARIVKRDRELGAIAPGKLADLILVDGNPATKISDIRRVAFVMKDGNIYDPAQLYKSLGIRP